MSVIESVKRPEGSHIWEQSENEWYVEPAWIGRRLIEVERFEGTICDPCCGLGNMLVGANDADFLVKGYDLVDRGSGFLFGLRDFLSSDEEVDNILCNPPFELSEAFAHHALRVARRKVAMIFPTRRINAAGKWLKDTPLYRIWYLTPRPSMPPGPEYLRLQALGKEASGGKQDFAVLVWLQGFEGAARAGWLHRDGAFA